MSSPEEEVLQRSIDSALLETATEWGSSRYEAYNRCPKAHDLRYHLKVVPTGMRPAHFGVGTLVHAVKRYVQEAVLAGGEGEDRSDWERVIEAARWREEFRYAAGKGGEDAFGEATRLMRFYWAFHGLRNAGWPDGYRILTIEEHLEDRSSFALPYTARADSILEIGGRVVVADTKTRAAAFSVDEETGAFKESVRRKILSRPQFIGLAHLAMQRFGLEEPPAILVDGIVKTKLPKCQRVFAEMPLRTVQLWREEMARLTLTGLASTQRHLGSCAPDMGHECDYFGYCHAVSEEAREENFKCQK